MDAPTAEAISLIDELSNWGRWGAADRRGTLNLVDAGVRRAAVSLVREGTAISCAWPVTGYQRFMRRTGEGLSDPDRVGGRRRWNVASEHVGMQFHSRTITHLDAPSHIFWDGLAYNRVPAAAVTAEWGATELDVSAFGPGLVTRGVLLDLPALRGVDWLAPGTVVEREELEAAERRQGVAARPGDALLVRVGQDAYRRAHGPEHGHGHAGLSAACTRLFAERSIALLAGDATHDVEPLPASELPIPIHVIALRAMGLWLIDNGDFEELAARCAAAGRWEFLFAVAPVLLEGATGSPVNPVAVF